MEFCDVESLCLAHALTPAWWQTHSRLCLALTGALIVMRFIAGAVLPLSADEAYYWLWSKHLAAGYYDHPPAIAFLIRGGTMLLGNTEIGVRAVPLALSVVATLFVWRSAAILLNDTRAGIVAALLFNLTLMVTVETLAATPDAPLIVCAAAFLYALVKLDASGDGCWWLALGGAGGLSLLSKYSAFFLGLGAVIWVVSVPGARRWLITPWPYLGLLVAAILFSPNLLWNAAHHWTTFAFQFGRIGAGHLTTRFLLEFLGAQLLLASPALLAIAALSLVQPSRGFGVLPALILPATIYFVIHALHDRVQGNWPCFLYPALAVAAAEGMLRPQWHVVLRRLALLSARLAIPLALLLTLTCYGQALFDLFPLGRKDPVSRLLAFGFPEVGRAVEAISATGGRPILTSDYETTAWLAFYTHVPVVEMTEEQRWPSLPAAPEGALLGPLLYLAETRIAQPAVLAQHYAHLDRIGLVNRTRNGTAVAQYVLYRVDGLKNARFGRMP